MEKNQRLKIQLVDNFRAPIRIAGIFIDLTFFLREMERYSFRVGATNNIGQLQITYDDVETKRLIHLEYQPWDYKTKLEECDSRVKITIPSEETLQRASHIAQSFNLGKMPQWAVDWLAAKNGQIEAMPIVVELSQDHIEVHVLCELIKE